MQSALRMVLQGVLACAFVSLLGAQPQLPTPREHYRSYDPQAAALSLIGQVFAKLDPAMRQEVTQLATNLRQGRADRIDPERIRQILAALDWQENRHLIVELMVHQSGALELVTGEAKKWRPLIHDFLLFFLGNLSEERFVDRLVGLTQLPPAAKRGDRIFALAERTPTLQKIGQILARYPTIPEELKAGLQRFENSIRTSTRQEVVDFVTSRVGQERLEEYKVEFSDEILAEASVGAVIRCRLTPPGTSRPLEAVAKVIKPYVVESLREELEILGKMAHFFERNEEFYEIGEIPLSETFQDVRDALSEEVRVVAEQENLKRAAGYYSDNPGIVIPLLYPISTPEVTFMGFIEGGKITDAPGDTKARARLAKRLSDALTFDVIYSPRELALFHGDPHAGNVFFVRGDPKKIALLDWGLSGQLPRRQRRQLVQLLLGIQLRNAKRLRNNVGALIEGGLPKSEREREEIRRIIDRQLEETAAAPKPPELFETLSDLIGRLAVKSHALDFNLALFVKSQLTIVGILNELDPKKNQADRAADRISKQVLKESPKRLFNTVNIVGWTKHNYPSMVSNEDIRDVANRKIVRGLGKLWKWIRYPFYRPRDKAQKPVESAANGGVP